MILINASNISVGGGIQVTLSLINEIAKLRNDGFAFVLPHFMKGSFFESEGFEYIYIDKVSFLKRAKFLDAVVKKHNVVKVFSVFGPTYWKPKGNIFHLEGFALPWVVYDDSPIYDRLNIKRKIIKKIYNKLRLLIINYESDEIWVETEDVKNRLALKIGHNNIHVFSNSVSDEFIKSELELCLPNRSDHLTYGLFLSHWYEHKNFELLFDTDFNTFNNIRYLVTLNNNDYNKIPSHLKSYFVNVGPVLPGQCKKLYDYCDFVVQPSFLECFSANLVESMHCRKPLLVSNLSFSTEICKESAMYFDPTSSESFNKTLREFLSINTDAMDVIKNSQYERVSDFMTSKDRAIGIIKLMERS